MTEPDALAQLRDLESKIPAAPWTVMTMPNNSHAIAHSSLGDLTDESIQLISYDGPLDETIHHFVCALRNVAHTVLSKTNGGRSATAAENLLDAWRDAAVTCPAPWTSWIEGRDGVAGDSFIITGEEQARGLDLYVRFLSFSLRRDYLQIHDFLAAAVNHLDELTARASADSKL